VKLGKIAMLATRLFQRMEFGLSGDLEGMKKEQVSELRLSYI
jgi:hypothetical protein